MCCINFRRHKFSTQHVQTECTVPVYNALKEYKNIYL